MRILLIEDDKVILDNIKKILGVDGWVSDGATTMEEADYWIHNQNYDCIVLDWMLPDGNGIDFLKRIRDEQNLTPVIMVTAMGQLSDKIEGLETGADDYLTKPFLGEELKARIKALVRRKEGTNKGTVVRTGDLQIDLGTAVILKNGKEINLSPKDYLILEFLAVNKGMVKTRDEIMEHVWGENGSYFSNTVDVHIRYLRKKIGENLIITVKGKGYKLCED